MHIYFTSPEEKGLMILGQNLDIPAILDASVLFSQVATHKIPGSLVSLQGDQCWIVGSKVTHRSNQFSLKKAIYSLDWSDSDRQVLKHDRYHLFPINVEGKIRVRKWYIELRKITVTLSIQDGEKREIDRCFYHKPTSEYQTFRFLNQVNFEDIEALRDY